MSVSKISNKKLSRNLKTKNAPLRVLPLATFPARSKVKKHLHKFAIQEKKSKPQSSSIVYRTVQKVGNISGIYVKKSCRKGPITIRPFLKFHFRMNTFRWIVLLIFAYLVAGMISMMIQDGTESIKNIIIYSIMGFFTFFMGYLGCFLARDVVLIVSGRKSAHNELEMDS